MSSVECRVSSVECGVWSVKVRRFSTLVPRRTPLSTLDSQLWTLNSGHSTLDSRLSTLPQHNVVRHELAGWLQAVEDRVAAVADVQQRFLRDGGTAITMADRRMGECCEHVDLGESVGRLLQAARLAAHALAESRKQLQFQRDGPLLRPRVFGPGASAEGALPGHVFQAEQGQSVELEIALNLSIRSPDKVDYLEVVQDGKVVHAEYVPEVTSEPNYDAALGALKAQL